MITELRYLLGEGERNQQYFNILSLLEKTLGYILGWMPLGLPRKDLSRNPALLIPLCQARALYAHGLCQSTFTTRNLGIREAKLLAHCHRAGGPAEVGAQVRATGAWGLSLLCGKRYAL